jgi:hypothetical protein
MGTDKNAARYQDCTKTTVKAPYLPPSTSYGPSFDVTGLASLLPPPMETGGLPTMPVGFAGIKPQ